MPPFDPNTLPAPYPPASDADRAALAAFARETPLTYGTWGRFKRLYKTVETNPLADPALFGQLAARIDAAPLTASDPPQPVALGPGVRGVESLVVMGRQVYCLLRDSSRTQKLAGYEFDPANPLHPILLGSVEMPGAASLIKCGPFICPLGGTQDSRILSIFDPTGGPRWRGTVALGGYARAVGAYPLVYAAVQGQKNAWSGLRILDLTDPDQPQMAGEVAIQEAQYVACDGSLVAITSGQTRFQWGQIPSANNTGGLHLVDVSTPSRPRPLGVFRRSNISAVALRGRWAFVGVDRTGQDDSAGLCLVDITNPSRPEQRGFFATSYYAPQSITLHGDFAYLTMQYGPPQVVNISRPEAPVAAEPIKTYSATAIGISEDTAYVGTSYQGLELYNVVNPGKPARIGTPPSGATLGYMKRRVRRTLRNFAKTNSEAYVSLAAATLTADGDGAAFEAARQWVVADILYGGSDRYIQGRHGRGPLVPTQPPRRRLRTREERAPQAWDKHLEAATALLGNPALPWPIHEAMFKIVLANGASLPAFSNNSLTGFLASPSPLLIHFAVRPLTARLESGAFVPPATAALAYVNTGTARRRVIEAALRRYGDADWCRAFAGQVFDVASLRLQNGRLPQRYASACEMVAQRFPSLIPDNLVRGMTAPLLNADMSGLTELVLALARRVSPPEALGWLQTLQSVAEAQQEQVVLALASGLTSQAFTLAEASALVLHYGDEFIRAAGWRLLTAGSTETAVFHALWMGLLDSLQETPPLKTAMSFPAALLGLARAGLSPQIIADRLRDKPFLAGLLSPQTFAAILSTVPASVALSMVAAVADDRWPQFRPFLLDYLRNGAYLADFWNAAPAALDTDSAGRLESRLLEDPEAAETLARVDDSSLLSIREPAFDTALGRWVRAHESQFTPNSPLLLQAATHVLPTIRAWALARVRASSPDLPFALRLLECGLPESVEVGGLFFTSLPAGDAQERSYALALCDSPLPPVRTLGRAFVSGRWDTLPREDLLRALFENSHPDMQAFVADLLGQSPTRPAETAEFDSEVLRTRHTARRAKEKVKARQSAELTVDIPTLLALARSRTPRDSEWALGQLTKLALSGLEIEGFTLTGVAGG